MIEVVTGKGAPCACSVMERKPANSWAKLCNGLWYPLIGVFRGCNAPAGSERVCNTKLKVPKDLLPTLKDKFDSGIKKKLMSIRSIVT